VILAKVSPRAGLDDDHFDPQRRFQPGPVGLARQLQGIVRSAQSSLAVSHNRQEILRSSHSPQRAELTERNVIATSGVRGLGGGFANNGQPGSSPACSLGMGVRQLRILVHQLAGDD
jgi:hypothetical protein